MTEIRLPWANWELGEEIGHGGFGTVYSIKNQISGEESALKVITIPKENSEIDSMRLEGYDDRSVAGIYREQLGKISDEYKIMARMKNHPNVVRCEDYAYVPHGDGIGWDIFIRMEKLDSLPRLLMRQNLGTEEVARLGIDICSALELCESNNIVHRDIKPENIFISEYSGYKLGDFGIARTMDHTTNATVSGTYRYMAPEVYMKKPYDNTVDIYSLGLVLYWLLNNRRMPYLPTDRVPKASENEAALEKRMSGQRMERPLNGSDALKDVVMKACAYNRKDRYQRAGEMKLALKNILNGRTNRGSTEEVWKSGSTYFETEETVGAATAGPATAGASATNYSYRTKTGPEVTVGNSWNDGGETVGARQGTYKAGESFYRDETVGEVPSHKGNTRTESVKTERFKTENFKTESFKTERNKADPELKFVKFIDVNYGDKEGSENNPYFLNLDLGKVSEGQQNKGSHSTVGSFVIPPWPISRGVYRCINREGEEVYFCIFINDDDRLSSVFYLIAGLFLLGGVFILPPYFLLFLGPVMVIMHVFILPKREKRRLNEYQKKAISKLPV